MPPKSKRVKAGKTKVKAARKQVEDEETKNDNLDEWESLDSELAKSAEIENFDELEDEDLLGEEKSTVKRRIQLKVIRAKIYQEQLAILRAERAAATASRLLNESTKSIVSKPSAAIGSFQCSSCSQLFKTADHHKYDDCSKYGCGYLPPNLYKPISPRHHSSSLSNTNSVVGADASSKMIFRPGIPLQGYRIGQCAFHPKELCPEQGDFCRSLINRCLQIDPTYRREHFLPLIFWKRLIWINLLLSNHKNFQFPPRRKPLTTNYFRQKVCEESSNFFLGKTLTTTNSFSDKRKNFSGALEIYILSARIYSQSKTFIDETNSS